MNNKTVVITGANRGIGLALTSLYQQQGASVIALCRKPSEALKQLKVTLIDAIDVTSSESIQALQKYLRGKDIHLLINNAGVLEKETLGDLDVANIERQFQVNAIAPLKVTDALLPNIPKGGKVAMITSRMGSISDNGSGGYYGYRMSKAALNAGTVSLARDLEPKGIAVGLFHPGMVQTEMINFNGDVSPQQAATGLSKRIDELNVDNSGGFWHAKGEVLPW